MKHLWELNHAYYCNLGNYRSNDCLYEFDSFEDFNEAWGNADLDYNLLFRWDWSQYDPNDHSEEEKQNPGHDTRDELKIFWMLQRHGDFRCCVVKVRKDDEQDVIEFLQPRWEYMKKLWEPLGETTQI
jgi:hypothetical protein